MNLAGLVGASAGRRREAPALRLDDAALSYAELDAAVARLAGLLSGRGVRPGDRVAAMLPNVCEFGVVYYGALLAGAVVVAADAGLRAPQLERVLADSGARLVLAWHALAETAEAAAQPQGADCVFVTPGEFERLLAGAEPHAEPCDRAPQDTATIAYGTGDPAASGDGAAEATHGGLARDAEAAARRFDLDEGDVTVGAVPLSDPYGQTYVLNASLRAGAEVTLMPRFEPRKALEVIQRDRATVFHGWPAMYAAMLEHPGREAYDTSSLRVCGCGGAAPPADVLRAFEAAFDVPVLEAGAPVPGRAGEPSPSEAA